jgi:hypothetical protein
MGVDGISSTGLAVASAVIAAAAAGVAVWRSILAGRQAREARKSRELSAVISLFNAHQAEDHSRIRLLIRNGAVTECLDDPEIRVELRQAVRARDPRDPERRLRPGAPGVDRSSRSMTRVGHHRALA